jgi:hypothetical protein
LFGFWFILSPLSNSWVKPKSITLAFDH